MASPLANKIKQQVVLETAPVQQHTIVSQPKSPLGKVNSNQLLPITFEQVDRLGDEQALKVGQTADKIVKTISLTDMDELGDIMAMMQVQSDKLNPESYKQNTLVSKVKSLFIDLKKHLKKELQSAEAAFVEIESKISNHIDNQTQWIQNLEMMYQENYQRYLEISEVINTLTNYETTCEQQINNFNISETDPDFGMKAQTLQDMNNVLHRIKIKKDNMTRLKALCEGNSPKIRSRQEASRSAISTLKDIMTQIIPMLKIEFSLFIQTIDTQKSLNFINNTRLLANKTLVTSADNAYTASVESAKVVNTANVSTDTLVHIRDKMIQSMKEVKTIQDNFMNDSTQTLEEVKKTQQQFLEELTKNNKIN